MEGRGRGREEKKEGPTPPDAGQHASTGQSENDDCLISTHEVVGGRHVAI